VLSPGPDGIGERLMRMFLSVWDAPPGRQRIVALLSASLTSDAGARMLREFLASEIFGRIVAHLRAEDAEIRASLAASQLMGVVVARYVVGVEPLASLPPDDVVAFIGPTLQAYLTGRLRA
jgi:hypothetical protein